MQVGDAFVFSFATTSDEHIYFVAHSEGNPASTIVLLNFTTHHPGKSDESCIIKPFDYKRLTRNSVIAYQRGRIVEGLAIQELIRTGIGKKLDPIPEPVMKKIRAGALTSPFTPLKIKKLLRA